MEFFMILYTFSVMKLNFTIFIAFKFDFCHLNQKMYLKCHDSVQFFHFNAIFDIYFQLERKHRCKFDSEWHGHSLTVHCHSWFSTFASDRCVGLESVAVYWWCMCSVGIKNVTTTSNITVIASIVLRSDCHCMLFVCVSKHKSRQHTKATAAAVAPEQNRKKSKQRV